jgi:hypothetical protein
MTTRTAPVPTTVEIIPTLAAAAKKRGVLRQLVTWFLLRAVGNSRSGTIDMAVVRDVLRQLGYSKTTMYDYLRDGEGLFWQRQRWYPAGWGRGKARKGLRLVGAQALANRWDLDSIGRWKTPVPVEVLTSGVFNSNGFIVASQAPRQKPKTFKRRNGMVEIRQGPKPHPISRAAQAEIMGFSERSLRWYDSKDKGVRFPATKPGGYRRKVIHKKRNFERAVYSFTPAMVERVSKTHRGFSRRTVPKEIPAVSTRC